MQGEYEAQKRAIEALVKPQGPATAQDILSELLLDGLPSAERVYKDIEEKILLPKTRLPDHWLPTYQM